MSRIGLAAVCIAAFGAAACVRRQYPVTSPRGAESAESQTDMLQFDNRATDYVDVYLVSGSMQWRLGRVSPGMHVMLRVPASAIDWTAGVMQLTVISGSQLSAQASRDPRAISAIAQPLSEVLSQRWTFRRPVGATLQLQAVPLKRLGFQ